MKPFRYDNATVEKDPYRQTYMDRLIDERKKEQNYDLGRLFIGWEKQYEWIEASTDSLWYPIESGVPFYIEIGTSNVILILGDRGSGKTFLVRGMASRLFKTGYMVMHLSDIKNEMRTNYKPIQSVFRDKLRRDEKPEGIPTTVYTPYFLSRFNKTKYSNMEYLQLDFSDMEETDLITAFNARSGQNPDPKIDLAVELFHKINDNTIETYDEIRNYIKNMDKDEVHGSTKKSFYRKIKDMERKGIFSTKYYKDIVNEVKSKFVSINFTGYDQMEKYPHVYMSMIVEKIRRAKKSGKLDGPIFFFIDEGHAFIPKRKDVASKEKIEKVINEDRQYGESVVISTQYPDQLPVKKVLRQVRYYFIPWNIDFSVYKDIIKSAGMNLASDKWTDKWVKLKAKAKKYEWIVIDKSARKASIVKVAAPLCNHLEESR